MILFMNYKNQLRNYYDFYVWFLYNKIIIIIIKYNIYIAPYSQVLYGAVHCYYNY